MRITRDLLLKIAKDTVAERTRSDRGILAVYLHGSLLSDEPLLGGATDIDLTFVHNEAGSEPREIVRLTDEVHLDIAHHPRTLYRQSKELRVHPWLGPVLYSAKILHDPQHFMDFIQASVRGQFYRPDNAILRSRSLAEHSRQLWQSLAANAFPAGPETAANYLRALEHGANAIASLSGPPLTLRRFLLQFPERAHAVGHPGLVAGLMGLLGAPNIDAAGLQPWLADWRSGFVSLPADQVPTRLHPVRLNYYSHAFDELLDSKQPLAALWPLMVTWTQAAGLLPEGSPSRMKWDEFASHLGWMGPAFSERVDALDAYLDTLEEVLDEWSRVNGA